MFGGGAKYKPPPPPPPPPNPPTYASQTAAGPSSASMGRFGGFSQSILTGPMGALDSRATQRKSLLGQ